MEQTEQNNSIPMSRLLWYRLTTHASLCIGGLLVSILILAAIFAPWLTTYDPASQDLLSTLQPPSVTHWFGTDDYGRDIFTRVLFGARITILEVVLSVGLSMLIGVPLGVLAGLSHRRVDQLIMWVMDIIFAFPGIVLAILIVSVLGEDWPIC